MSYRLSSSLLWYIFAHFVPFYTGEKYAKISFKNWYYSLFLNDIIVVSKNICSKIQQRADIDTLKVLLSTAFRNKSTMLCCSELVGCTQLYLICYIYRSLPSTPCARLTWSLATFWQHRLCLSNGCQHSN